MININVLRLNRARSVVDVYTFYPFSPNGCERIETKLLMTLSHNNAAISFANNFFPYKLRNFYQCPLWLGTSHVPPYMILHRLNNGSYETSGIEGNLYYELSKSLNFTPMVHYAREKYATENFALLKKGKVNLTMFAAINTAERSRDFTTSFPYVYTAVVFTVC